MNQTRYLIALLLSLTASISMLSPVYAATPEDATGNYISQFLDKVAGLGKPLIGIQTDSRINTNGTSEFTAREQQINFTKSEGKWVLTHEVCQQTQCNMVDVTYLLQGGNLYIDSMPTEILASSPNSLVFSMKNAETPKNTLIHMELTPNGTFIDHVINETKGDSPWSEVFIAQAQ
jgi:hypothetical protein